MQQSKLHAIAVLALLCGGAALGAEDIRYPAHVTTDHQRQAWRIGWPQLHGPTCDGRAIDCGYPLVGDFSKAREVWESEEFIPPSELNEGGCLRSGYATPVMANGRVYIYYTWPSNLPADATQITRDQVRALNTGRRDRTDKSDKPGDDVVVCMDALNGKTLWKRKFEKQGETLLGSGKGGGHGTMLVHSGRAYAFGMAGWIYCLDAATGETIWAGHKHPKAHSPNATPVIADGVLIYRLGSTLFGHDARTGKQLWSQGGAFQGVRNASFTRVWKVDGRELFIHENACYEPRTGKELWNVGDMEGGNTTAVYGNYMVCREANKGGPHGVRCFRISPQGAELAWWWKEPWVIKGWASPVFTNDGWVAIDMQAPKKDRSGKKARLFGMFELATGKVVTMPGHYKAWKYQSIGAEGKYIYTGGYNVWIANLDPNNLKELSNTDIDFSHDCSPAYACGILFVRDNFRLRAFDLRVPGAPVRPMPTRESSAREDRPEVSKPAARPEPDAVSDQAKAKFETRLLTLTRKACRTGQEISLRLASMRRMVRVTNVQDQNLVLAASGMSLSFDFNRLSSSEKRELAVAVADALGTDDAAAVADFYR